MQRERLLENLHIALYGHRSVAIETSGESFRKRCSLRVKRKECLVRGSVWPPARWLLFGQRNINGCSKSPLRIKGQQIRQAAVALSD